MELNGKIAVVTGASMGIGRSLAVAFARAGADVAFTYGVHSEDAEETAELIRKAGRRVFYRSCDAKVSEQNRSFMEDTLRTFGQVDILVNNVGGADFTPDTGFADMPLDYWHSQFEKNFFSAVVCSAIAAKSMIPRKTGCIINIGSVHTSRIINLNVMPYACAKQAMNHLTRALAVELAPYGIRVNSVAPGLVKTALTEHRYDADWWDKVYEKIPLHRAAIPEEIAEMVLFLASDKAGYISGQIIGVDGGRSL